MALIKTGTTVANVAASQKRVEDVTKLAGDGVEIGLNLASSNYIGAATKGISAGAKAIISFKDNYDFIADETSRIKKWDNEHNADGSKKEK